MHLSRRRFIGASTLLVATPLAPSLFAQTRAVDRQVLSAIDDAALASIKAGACPAVAIRVCQDGRELVSQHYGLANIETGSPLGEQGVFRIGSLTKQFTAALILKLAADRRLALDDAVSKYLPFFPAGKLFTLRELMNHTAGLHDDPQEISCPAGSREPKSQIQLAREMSGQKKLFDFDPGTAWLYSNANYIVLGAVAEQITGMPLAQATSTLIFGPLGLAHTAFDRSDAVVPGRVSGYSPLQNGKDLFAHAAFIEISDTGGAGAMRSTAADLCQWHASLFANRLFSADFVRMMIEPGRLRDGRLGGSNRFSPDDASYGDVQYGMGLLIPPAAGGVRSVLHYGFINGFATCLETYLEHGLTTAILCNGDMGPNHPIRSLRQIVSKQLLPGLASAKSMG